MRMGQAPVWGTAGLKQRGCGFCGGKQRDMCSVGPGQFPGMGFPIFFPLLLPLLACPRAGQTQAELSAVLSGPVATVT